jgi:multidrug efflux pump subunit AcrB
VELTRSQFAIEALKRILFDPIFQGLAISLMAGEVASTLLSRMAVPVLYYISERGAK